METEPLIDKANRGQSQPFPKPIHELVSKDPRLEDVLKQVIDSPEGSWYSKPK